ncbi:XRE family transcriptional regulator [Streptomyces sp. NPDC056210]|uniref:XRE family transcriptional regulator n=1 Tax=Streptomyces sp. NPDC056210 TaxID=3345746 RepID=UPI0035E07552
MDDAKVTRVKLAHQLGVSVKQVGRWLDKDVTPHGSTRADAARALGVDEDMLWPQKIRDRIKTGDDVELLHSYPYRSACPSTVWGDLATEATEEILLSGYTNYFFWSSIPNFSNLLRRKAQEGVRVRFLLGDPEGEVTRQREVIEDAALSVSARIRISLKELGRLGPLPGLEVRYSAAEDAVNHVSLSVFRFDSEALVTPHLARLVGHDSPLLHLRKQGDGGMFDRFAEHAEELWSRGVQVSG